MPTKVDERRSSWARQLDVLNGGDAAAMPDFLKFAIPGPMLYRRQ